MRFLLKDAVWNDVDIYLLQWIRWRTKQSTTLLRSTFIFDPGSVHWIAVWRKSKICFDGVTDSEATLMHTMKIIGSTITNLKEYAYIFELKPEIITWRCRLNECEAGGNGQRSDIGNQARQADRCLKFLVFSAGLNAPLDKMINARTNWDAGSSPIVSKWTNKEMTAAFAGWYAAWSRRGEEVSFWCECWDADPSFQGDMNTYLTFTPHTVRLSPDENWSTSTIGSMSNLKIPSLSYWQWSRR